MPHHEADRFEGRSGFGVRRPLRFLAHKLDLNEKQITELARILDELKIERSGRRRRPVVLSRNSPIRWLAKPSTPPRSRPPVTGASRAPRGVRETLTRSLQQIHALLTPEQRERLAYLIRTGILAI